MTRVRRAIAIFRRRIREQGVRITMLWAADHAVRIVTGAPIRSLSQIAPHIHVGGQHRRRGLSRLKSRGVTAVVNMRIEYDDTEAGVALSNHLHLKVVDDDTPTAEQLHIGVAFVQDQIEKNGSVYIHCGSGIGRAPTMAAAYLLSTGLTTEQAWALIRKTRPFIRPTPVQVEQIEQFAALSKSEERLSAAATLESED